MPRHCSGIPLILSLSLVAGLMILLPRHPLDSPLPLRVPIQHSPASPFFHSSKSGTDTVTAADAMLQSREITGTRHLDRLSLQQQVRALAHCDTMDACGQTRLDVKTLNALLPPPSP